MNTIRLNGSRMLDRETTHAYLKRKLNLPDYYGNNLDALWDCLSTDFTPKKIVISEPDAIMEKLGPYGEALLQVFKEVAEDNGFFVVEIEKKEATKKTEF